MMLRNQERVRPRPACVSGTLRRTWRGARVWLAGAAILMGCGTARADTVKPLLGEVDRLLLPWHGEGSFDAADQKRLIEQTETALAKARQAEELAPNSAYVKHRLGVCLSLLKRYPEAEAAFTKAERAAKPDFLPTVLQDRGLCAMRQEQYDRALEFFQRVLALRNWQPDTRYHMGLIYERRGMPERALQLYAQEFDHQNRNTKAWQAYFRLKGTDREKGRSLKRTFGLLGVWVVVLLAAGGLALMRHRRRAAAAALASSAATEDPEP